jgi:DNA polymerase elongation subunit (family B)
MTLAYDSKVNYDDVFGQVKMWDVIIYNHLLRKGIQIPPRKDTSKRKQFEGAYVKDPKPGLYNWVVSFDFTSLYPHLIMMYNISPETLVEPVDYAPELESWVNENRNHIDVDHMLAGKLDTSVLKRHNVTMTPNRQLFTRAKHGFLAEIMDSMYKDRAKYKKFMNQAKAELEKIDAELQRRGASTPK